MSDDYERRVWRGWLYDREFREVAFVEVRSDPNDRETHGYPQHVVYDGKTYRMSNSPIRGWFEVQAVPAKSVEHDMRTDPPKGLFENRTRT